MNLSDVTDRLKAQGDRALVPFFTAGYPDERTFLALMRTAAEVGCQLIEIGIPFSDPIADGPVIQESSTLALRSGVTVERCFDLARRAADDAAVPIAFMTYLNPVLKMGVDRFAERAASAGVSGVIVPDLPVEESSGIREVFAERGIALIGLVAPTSSDERIARIARETEGFVYLVSVTGVTGSRFPSNEELARMVERVRARTSRPAYLGFGVSDPSNARAAAEHADGVILGSALIRRIGATRARHAVRQAREFLLEMKSAIARDGPTVRPSREERGPV